MANGVNPIGNLLGKVDANGALLVALDGTSPATASRFFADASATLPGFSITGDTNTGFGASAADTAAVWAGGATPIVLVSSSAVTSTVPIALGTNPASAGMVRLPNAEWVRWRNAANSADLSVIRGTTGDTVEIGVSIDSGHILPYTGLSNTYDLGSSSRKYRSVYVGSDVVLTALAISGTAPTIASGFGTSPSIPNSNGTAAFTVNVGTGGTAQNGVITLPAASNGWVVTCVNITNNATSVVEQTAGTTTSATIQNYSRTSGLATAWAASDILRCTAVAY